MRDESFAFLQNLLEAPSPSGYEQPAQRIFRAYVAPFARVSTDVMGNVFGAIEGIGDAFAHRCLAYSGRPDQAEDRLAGRAVPGAS